MDFMELVSQNRSTRTFDESRVITRDELVHLVSLARLAPSASNKQPLKYFLSCDAQTNALIQPLTGWAGALPELHLPPKGHMPTAFIVICVDKKIAGDAAKDVGIVAQTMMLGACEMGLAGCMIGSSKPELRKVLGLDDNLEISLVLALGKGEEDIRIVDAQDSVAYYRDAAGTHFVPKRTLEEIIIGGRK